MDDAKKIRCWAHSHPGMDVFWSHTDDTNCRRLCSDWLVSIVVSDGFKIRTRIDVASPVAFTVDYVPTFCESPIDAVVREQCAAEVKDKIKPMPLFGLGSHKKLEEGIPVEIRSLTDEVEMVEYCEECGSWHHDDECPLRFQTGYDLARQERQLVADTEAWEDGVWF